MRACSRRTFNTLTDSIAAFQREAAQRERLSSLGRMSTILAHEIRNPLMIIKGALRQLSRPDATAADIRDAAADIDGETERLNRLVNEVLDFARPMRFDRSPTDINALCRDAAGAVAAVQPQPAVVTDLDRALPALETDREKLRTVLINLLTNARQAVAAGGGAGQRRPRHPVHPAAARPPRRHRRARPRCRDRVGGPAAGLRSVLHHASRPAPASGCRSPRTSSTASAVRSPSKARPAPAPASASSSATPRFPRG